MSDCLFLSAVGAGEYLVGLLWSGARDHESVEFIGGRDWKWFQFLSAFSFLPWFDLQIFIFALTPFYHVSPNFLSYGEKNP